MRHCHHNYCIKIVPFNQADKDKTSKHYTVLYMHTQTASLKELGTLVKLSTHVSVFCPLNIMASVCV